MAACTLATIAALLGYQPAPGAMLEIPAARLQAYTAAEISHAKACLRRHGFRWRIVER